MEYGLKRLVLGSKAFVPISENEYCAISEAQAGLFEAVFVEEKIDLVVENYLELETSFLDSTARNMVLKNQDYQWAQLERSLFNRRLANLLSACRSYIDHSKHHIRAILPKGADAIVRFENEFSHRYDTSLGYRVMEALRNFAQHRGFPIHASEYTGSWVGDGDDARLVFGLALYVKTKYLREDREFKKEILEELEKLGGRVDLRPLVRDYVGALGGIHELLREMIQHSVQAWEKVLMDAIERFKKAYPQDSSVVGLAAVQEIEGRFERPVAIFTDFIDYRKALQRKNTSFDKFSKRFLTGETIKKDV